MKGFYPQAAHEQRFRQESLVAWGTGEHFRAAREDSWPVGRKLKSALFLVDFEIQNDVLAAVEAGDRAGWGFGAFFFRMQFVIGIRIQAAETVAAGVIGVTATDRIGAHVFQKNNAAGKRAIGLVRHHAADGAELSFVLLVLSRADSRKQQ
jgi:hypothetical protein